MDRSPYASFFSQRERDQLAGWIGRFMFRLRALVWNLVTRYADVTVFQFNINSLFTQVLNNATQFAETAGYVSTNTYCLAYQK